jgi:hypothetical protein
MSKQVQEGGVYSVKEEDGTYGAIKILKIDDQGVHIRQYSNQFLERPASVDSSTLYMAGIHRKPNEKLGLGHTPISNESFANWQIQLIHVEPTTDEELEGYEYWKEENGGYF